MNDLTFRFAENHVDMCDGAHDVMKDYREGMDCRNCEGFIKLCIETHGWLVRADAVCRDLEFEAIKSDDKQCDYFGKLEVLMRRWLSICDRAGDWIDLQLKRGFVIENFDEFKNCEERIRLSLEELDEDNETLSPAMEKHQQDAIQEHADGKTAEFI